MGVAALEDEQKEKEMSYAKAWYNFRVACRSRESADAVIHMMFFLVGKNAPKEKP